MAKYLHLECPDCGGTFKWLRHPSDEPLPNFCPRCGSNLAAEPVFVPEAPHVAKTIGKTADGVYRQMEQASRDHQYLAAEMTGDDPSDYAAMRLNDMPDYLRAGDIAAKIPTGPNPVSDAIAKGIGGFNFGQTGAEYAQATGVGAFPHAGEATRQMLSGAHAGMARAIEARGLSDGGGRRRRG